jgi:signal transduction histidine kinase
VDGQRPERGFTASADSARISTATAFAHEIHNPLDSLLNLLYLIKAEATLTAKGHHYLFLAQEEVRRISQIAGEVLNQQRARTIPEDTNIVQLLRGVIDFYQSRFASRRITVATRYCSVGDARVNAGQVRQMLSNLLLNAADATPAGGTLHARVSRAHEWCGKGRHGVRVTVADNGSGIAAENLPRIFDPFFTTKGSGGNGMGLSVVRDAVRRHDGLLHVRSSTKPGRSGTVFTVFLPAQANEPSESIATSIRKKGICG